MSRAIVIFARSPEREAIAKKLPIDRAAALFRSHVAAWERAARAAHAVVLRVEQKGRTFGERLANAADDAFARGYTAIVLTGIDVPAVDLEAAFRSIECGRPVIAPARDGGVNLIGLGSPARGLLSRFRQRDRGVADLCRAYFESVHELPVTRDVDTIHDFYAILCEERPQPVAGRLKPPRKQINRIESPRAPPLG